jgi:hypothetical protein
MHSAIGVGYTLHFELRFERRPKANGNLQRWITTHMGPPPAALHCAAAGAAPPLAAHATLPANCLPGRAFGSSVAPPQVRRFSCCSAEPAATWSLLRLN